MLFDFRVYNKKTEREHDLTIDFDTDSTEEAERILNDRDSRYEVLSVKKHVHVKKLFIECDFGVDPEHFVAHYA